MLKTIRQSAIENPWFFRILMGIIGVTFVISMGWGFGNSGSGRENVVATVDTETIQLREYKNAYEKLSKTYREFYKDNQEFDDKMVKKAAIDQLVARQIWLKAAKELSISVSDQELMESISNILVFQKPGEEGNPGPFDMERYQQVLADNNLGPEFFEKSHRNDLVIDKVKKVVQDAVQLTQKEIDEAKENLPAGRDPERAVSDALYLKRQKALLAFSTNVKSRSTIEIRQELL